MQRTPRGAHRNSLRHAIRLRAASNAGFVPTNANRREGPIANAEAVLKIDAGQILHLLAEYGRSGLLLKIIHTNRERVLREHRHVGLPVDLPSLSEKLRRTKDSRIRVQQVMIHEVETDFLLDRPIEPQ